MFGEEKLKARLREKSYLTAEEMFYLGIRSEEQIFENLPEEKRGLIKYPRDVKEVRDMVESKRFSIMEVASSFSITWRTVYDIMGWEIPKKCRAPQVAPKAVTTDKRRYAKRFNPSAEERVQMVVDYENGVSTRELAAKYGASRQAVKHVLIVEGATVRDERKDGLSRAPKLMREDKEAIDGCWVMRQSPKEIAQNLGMTEVQVRYYLRKNRML